MEPEPPPRGSDSRGAVERPCASSGRDPGVWRGVGRGDRFAQNVPGLPGRGAAAALSQVRDAQRARLADPLGNQLFRSPLEQRAWSLSGASPPHSPTAPPPPLLPPPLISRVEPGLTLPLALEFSQAPDSTDLSCDGVRLTFPFDRWENISRKASNWREHTASQEQTKILIKVSYHPLTWTRVGLPIPSHQRAYLPGWGAPTSFQGAPEPAFFMGGKM